MKFAAQRNPRVIGGHYLHDLTTIDGASSFLGMDPRRDLTEDFRTATLRRNPDVSQSLPSHLRKQLKERDDYIAITKEIGDLNIQIETAAACGKDCDQYKAKRVAAYKKRAKLEKDELITYQMSAKRVHPAQREGHQTDRRRTHFDRIRHMVPERDRLARTLFQRVSLRSPEGISAMRDLIALRTNDSRIAYQEVLRPTGSRCPVDSCRREMES